jgi:hypothetical protein
MKIQVFDPPMCCSTGICGPGVDPALVTFSADLDWIKRQGIEVERYNLSQQTQAFVSNPTVAAALKKDGNDCLPLILVDGNIASQGTYLSREKLAELAHLEFSESEQKTEPTKDKNLELKFTVQQAKSKLQKLNKFRLLQRAQR